MKFRLHRDKIANDERGKRIVAVIHCILNQNSRDLGAATHEGMHPDLIEICVSHGIGILQMPCPEMHCLGLARTRPKGYSIRDMLEIPFCRKAIAGMSAFVADQVLEFIDSGCEILAVVGGDVESPGCAVHHAREGDMQSPLLEKSGIFMQELEKEFHRRGLDIPFVGLRESNPKMLAKDMAWLKTRLTL